MLMTTTVLDELDDAAAGINCCPRFDCSANRFASSAARNATSRISPQCLHFFALASTSSPQKAQFVVGFVGTSVFFGSSTPRTIGGGADVFISNWRDGIIALGFGLSTLDAATRGMVIGLPHFLHLAVRPAASSGAFSCDLQFGHSTGITSMLLLNMCEMVECHTIATNDPNHPVAAKGL